MLRITNTFSGQKEPFVSGGDPVRFYVCGMTPKFHPHVGHARIFVAADVIRRYLEYRGLRVYHVQNFTDIDDKIIARASEEGITPADVAAKYTASYFEAMDALNVLRAHEYPTVTGFMPQIIAFIEALIAKGYAYVADGDVWFAVERFPSYGALSGRHGALDEGLVGARKELEPGKRDPRDFALWKRAKPGEPAWDSPWGPGRPGWHIECSTMVRATLGDTIDLHGGGQDLIFPHHENERAQSEALLGHPFVRYWVHVGLVTTGGEKMSHSLLNFRTVQEVLAHHEPMALRLYLLQTHYRAPLAFREEAVAAAARGLARLRAALEPLAAPAAPLAGGAPDGAPSGGELAARARARFETAMDDDFNTAAALAALFDLAAELNARRQRAPADPEIAAGQAVLRELAGVLGLDLTPRPGVTAARAAVEPFIELLLAVRQELRRARQWALADRIRDGLRELGVIVEDRPDTTTWRFE
ncbi:MAG TPA: cysteine--tRNA ligase [Chloroflexota bacterium]|nr:cysteine--tRNA ligase [Chloroflexota bacterium]